MSLIKGDSKVNPIDLTRPPIMLRIPNPWGPHLLPSPPASPKLGPEIRQPVRLHLNPPMPHLDHTQQEFVLTDGAIERIRKRARREARREAGLD